MLSGTLYVLPFHFKITSFNKTKNKPKYQSFSRVQVDSQMINVAESRNVIFLYVIICNYLYTYDLFLDDGIQHISVYKFTFQMYSCLVPTSSSINLRQSYVEGCNFIHLILVMRTEGMSVVADIQTCSHQLSLND